MITYDERLQKAADQITRYFDPTGEPRERATHQRTVEGIIARNFPDTPAVVLPVRASALAEPNMVTVTPTVVPAMVIVEEKEPDTGIKTVAHVRGDVRAYSMGKKAVTVVGQRYLVSFNGAKVTMGGVPINVAISFESKLIAKSQNAAGEEILEWENGVILVDEMERFRFQRVPA